MRVLVVHNRYLQRGGEDVAVEHLVELLASQGATVGRLTLSLIDLKALGILGCLRFAAGRLGLPVTSGPLKDTLRDFRPDVVHFHNIFPLFGWRAMREAGRHGCSVVWTVHNYRISCLAGTHLYEGHICEKCSIGAYGWGVRRGCYRHSRFSSFAMSRMLTGLVRFLETPSAVVPIYLTDFARNRYARYGFCGPVISNAIRIPELVERTTVHSGAVFVGRLSPEKGVEGLLSHWGDEYPLTLIGDGPGLDSARRMAGRNITVSGWLDREAVLDAVSKAKVLVVPSIWYEGLPTVVLEAYALGIPVVCFGSTAVGEFVAEATPGLVVSLGEFEQLVDRAEGVLRYVESEWQQASNAVLAAYESRATPDVVYPQLMAAYQSYRARGGTL